MIDIINLLVGKYADGDFSDSLYVSSVKQAERIKAHSELNYFPHSLFVKRAPNQTEDEYEYIKANHKCITFPIFQKYQTNIYRIWNDANWNIQFNDNSQKAIEYLYKDYPSYGSLELYFRDIVTATKLKDPNSVLVVKPEHVPTKQVGEETVIDENKEIEPIAFIYASKNVLEFSEYHCLILLDEKSVVYVGSKAEQTGLMFEYYDVNTIYRITQVGQKKDKKFDIQVYYNHNLNYLPCYKLKGDGVLIDNKVYYLSSFVPALDTLDSVLLDNSYLIAQKATHAFQHKWEYVDECDFIYDGSHCMNGKIFRDGLETVCPSCNGSGNKAPGVLGVTQIKRPKNINEVDIKNAPFGFISPDPTILEFLRKEIDIQINSALRILGLGANEQKGSETALGKIVDREETFATLLNISNQVFELFEQTIKTILDMRYIDKSELYYPTINYPKNFALRSESELTEEIARARELNLPEVAFRNLILEYMNIRFTNYSKQAVDLVFYTDRIVSLSDVAIASKRLQGSIATWEDILHTSIYTFIAQALVEDANFFDKTIQEQSNVLIQKAKALELEIKPVANTNDILNSLAVR